MGSDGWYPVSGRTTVGRARPQHYGLGVQQDSSDSDSNADAEAPGGAIAVMFLVWAVLLLFAPAYFGSAGAARTVWYVFAGISGTIGVGGAAVELSGVSRREALKGKGAPMACAMIYWGTDYQGFFDVFIEHGAVVDLRPLNGLDIGPSKYQRQPRLL